MVERFLAEGIETFLGERLSSVRPMDGGCIGEVYKVKLIDGSTVVAKVDRAAEAHLEREAYMLRYLREKSELPVPEVFHGSETLLLMEFIEGNNRFTDDAQRHAAELLATLHDVTANAYGHERDTLIGSIEQPNPWTVSWVEFFRDRRLLYLAGVSHEAGRLPTNDLNAVHRLSERLDDLIEEPERPALIHGDAWRGNVLAQGDRITAFLDPAIYHADPEMELAFIALFDSFGTPFFDRYSEIREIRESFYTERRDLYTLYPLLVHVYFFGGGYLNSAQNILHRFGAYPA